jgi:hypothetical protein
MHVPISPNVYTIPLYINIFYLSAFDVAVCCSDLIVRLIENMISQKE